MLDPAPLPLLVLPEYVLLPGTLVPFHATEAAPQRLFGAALADRRLLVVAGTPMPSIAALGRIVSDRRYPDGCIDVFVHALERVRVVDVSAGPDGLVARVASAPDVAESRATRAAGQRLRRLAIELAAVLGAADRGEEAEALRAVAGSTPICGLLANRLGSQLVLDPIERQRLLETDCPAERAERLVRRLGELMLASARSDAALH
ncbi:MAG: LON peptidase substrate-binding domain-containing protein [Myxococcota bacterium]